MGEVARVKVDKNGSRMSLRGTGEAYELPMTGVGSPSAKKAIMVKAERVLSPTEKRCRIKYQILFAGELSTFQNYRH